MTFNIGKQTGGVVNNVAGDQYVEGSQSGVGQATVSLPEAREALALLRGLLLPDGLPAPSAQDVQADLDGATEELAKPEPDRPSIAQKLKRVIETMISTGSLIGASSQILGSLHALVQWLGPAGAHLVARLPALA